MVRTRQFSVCYYPFFIVFGLLCDVPMVHVVARSFFNARDQVLAANKSEIGNRGQVLGKSEARPSLGRVCRSS